MNRDEFLAALKAKALELVRAGDLQHAVSVLTIELNRRPDMHVHHAFTLAGTMAAMNDDKPAVIKWIESIE